MTTLHLLILSTFFRFTTANFTSDFDSRHFLRLKDGLRGLTRLTLLMPANCDFNLRRRDSSKGNYVLELRNCKISESLLDSFHRQMEVNVYKSPGTTLHRVKRSNLGDNEKLGWPHSIRDPYFETQWHIVSLFYDSIEDFLGLFRYFPTSGLSPPPSKL